MTNDKKVNSNKAVALQYDGKKAPTVTAKGEALTAEQIIAIAKAHGVHLHQDTQLVNLLATIDIGHEIPQQLYIVIAQIIAFVYWLENKTPEGFKPPSQSTEIKPFTDK